MTIGRMAAKASDESTQNRGHYDDTEEGRGFLCQLLLRAVFTVLPRGLYVGFAGENVSVG